VTDHLPAALAVAERERRAVEELEAALADPWTWAVIARHAATVREATTGPLAVLLGRVSGVATEVEAALAAASAATDAGLGCAENGQGPAPTTPGLAATHSVSTEGFR
jgi:hypothetical protein